MSQVTVDMDIAQDIARNVKNYVETACGEMGHQFESIDDLEYDFPEVYALLSDRLQDLAGDRIYDLMEQKGLKASDQKVFQAYADVVAKYFPGVTLDWSL